VSVSRVKSTRPRDIEGYMKRCGKCATLCLQRASKTTRLIDCDDYIIVMIVNDYCQHSPPILIFTTNRHRVIMMTVTTNSLFVDSFIVYTVQYNNWIV